LVGQFAPPPFFHDNQMVPGEYPSMEDAISQLDLIEEAMQKKGEQIYDLE